MHKTTPQAHVFNIWTAKRSSSTAVHGKTVWVLQYVRVTVCSFVAGIHLPKIG